MQALPDQPESLCIVEMGGASDADTGGVSAGGLFLNIGLQNGTLLRTSLDRVTGDLSDTRTRHVIGILCTTTIMIMYCTCIHQLLLNYSMFMSSIMVSFIILRFIGTRGVKLFRVKVHSGEALVAVSSRTWLSYTYQSRFHLTPLSYDVLEYTSSFSSEQCPEGIVAIASNTLRSANKVVEKNILAFVCYS